MYYSCSVRMPCFLKTPRAYFSCCSYTSYHLLLQGEHQCSILLAMFGWLHSIKDLSTHANVLGRCFETWHECLVCHSRQLHVCFCPLHMNSAQRCMHLQPHRSPVMRASFVVCHHGHCSDLGPILKTTLNRLLQTPVTQLKGVPHEVCHGQTKLHAVLNNTYTSHQHLFLDSYWHGRVSIAEDAPSDLQRLLQHVCPAHAQSPMWSGRVLY